RAAAVTPACPAVALVAEPGAVLEVPMGSTSADVSGMGRGLAHGHPVVNGYSGHEPPHYPVLEIGLRRADRDLLDMLSSLGVRHVLVNERKRGDRLQGWLRYVAQQPG